MDPPSDASIDDVLFGVNSDCGSIASISSNIVMEDASKETSLIYFTNPDKKYDSKIADNDTSASRKVPHNLTISKNILKFLKEIQGLIKYPITHIDMIDTLMGTDRASYERDKISQWLRESAISTTLREHMQMHYLIPGYTTRRILSALEAHTITEEFIDHINKASLDNTEKSQHQFLLH